MKRFRSSYQKVYDILQQQSRIAELELARARSFLAIAEQNVQRAVSEFESTREEVHRAMSSVRQSTVILMMQEHIGAAGDRIEASHAARAKAELLCQQAKEKYQSIHSQVERVEKLIDRQREQHRQEMLQHHQKNLDDVAIFRWKQSEQEKVEVSHHD